jgi:hypothetical protein
MMGHMLPNYFSYIKNQNTKNKYDIDDEHDLEQYTHLLSKNIKSNCKII